MVLGGFKPKKQIHDIAQKCAQISVLAHIYKYAKKLKSVYHLLSKFSSVGKAVPIATRNEILTYLVDSRNCSELQGVPKKVYHVLRGHNSPKNGTRNKSRVIF